MDEVLDAILTLVRYLHILQRLPQDLGIEANVERNFAVLSGVVVDSQVVATPVPLFYFCWVAFLDDVPSFYHTDSV